MILDRLPTGPIGPEHNGIVMTPEEFDGIDDWDENYRYELIHGVLLVCPFRSAAVRSANDELGRLIRDYMYVHPDGQVVDETLYSHTIRLSTDRRIADRVVWIGLGRAPDPDRDIPAIAIEFVSRTRRDRRRDHIIKRQEFAAIGVEQYWVIDRFRRTMTVYLRSGEVIELTEGDVYLTDLLPGFELPLARLFARSDRYPNS